MNIELEQIDSDDDREVDQLAVGESITHRVPLRVDGQPRSFFLYLERARAVARTNAGLLYGDALLMELLRFDPEAQRKLYAAVGQHRRGQLDSLPLVLSASNDDVMDPLPGANSG